MTVQPQLLDRLSELRPDDRAWILNHLSGRERAALMETARRDLDGESAPPTVSAPAREPAQQSTTAQAEVLDQIALVQGFSVEQVAAVLRAEPAWIIAAVLSIEAWQWSQTLLERLPQHVRMEVLRLREKSLTLAPGMRSTLVGMCATRFAQVEVPKQGTRILESLRRLSAKLSRQRPIRL